MNYDQVRQMAASFPGVEEHLAFGRPTIRLRNRFLACVAKIDEDTLCLKLPDQREREFLLSTQPDIYYLTDHYANFECVLVRMPLADPHELRALFEMTWRHYASKRLLAQYQPQE